MPQSWSWSRPQTLALTRARANANAVSDCLHSSCSALLPLPGSLTPSPSTAQLNFVNAHEAWLSQAWEREGEGAHVKCFKNLKCIIFQAHPQYTLLPLPLLLLLLPHAQPVAAFARLQALCPSSAHSHPVCSFLSCCILMRL